MAEVILPKSTKKFYYQIFKGISFIDIIIFTFFLSFGILITWLLSTIIMKIFFFLIIILFAFVFLIKINDEIRIYHFIFNGFKYFCKRLIKKKIYIIPPYINTTKNNVLGCKYRKEIFFLSGIKIETINLNLINDIQQNHLINDFSNLLKIIFLPLKIIKIDENYHFEEQILSLQKKIEAKDIPIIVKKIIDLEINQFKTLSNNKNLKTPGVYLLWFAKNEFEANNQLQLVNEALTFSNLKYTNLSKENIINCWKKLTFNHKSLSFTATGIKQNDKKGFIWSLNNLPNKITTFWLYQLFHVENINIIVNINPINKIFAKKRIDEAINKINTNFLYVRSESEKIENEHYEEAFLQQQQSILEDIDVLKEISIFIICTDKSKKKINNVKKQLKNLSINNNWNYNKLFFEQAEAIISSYTCYNLIPKTTTIDMTCDTFATSFPISDIPLIDKEGFLLAETISGKPVVWDLFFQNQDRINKNVLIFGESGSGKSFTAKKIILNQVYQNTKIFILDPENEFKTLVNNLNGKVIDLAGNLNNVINPLEIIKFDINESDFDTYTNHFSFLETFFILLFPNLNNNEMTLYFLIEIIKEVYQWKRITEKTDFSNISNIDFPTFNDVYDLICKKLTFLEVNSKDRKERIILEALKLKLYSLTKGIYARFWNGITKFDWKQTNIVCFNLIYLLENNNKKIISIQMMLILRLLYKEMISIKNYNEIVTGKKRKKIIIIVDEAHLLINENNPVALDFLFHTMKRIRKYNGSLIIITQNINDFTGNEVVKKKFTGILNSAQYWLIGGLQPEDINSLNRMYQQSGGLSEAVKIYISKASQGIFWFKISKQEQLPIQILQFPHEIKIFENIEQTLIK